MTKGNRTKSNETANSVGNTRANAAKSIADTSTQAMDWD